VSSCLTPEYADEWISAGAILVIVTSCLFDAEGTLHMDRMIDLVSSVRAKSLVLDLIFHRIHGTWTVILNIIHTLTELLVTVQTLDLQAKHCSDILILAADVERLCT